MSDQKNLKTLEEILECSRQALDNFKAPENKDINFLLQPLICTIFENCSACYYLLTSRHYTPIPIIIRSATEAHVDILNLARDENYKNVMLAEYAQQQYKFLKNATSDNPFTARIVCDSQYNKNKKLFKKMSEKYNKHKLKIWKKFQKVGILDLYNGVYSMLCCESHNNLLVLGSRHITVEDNVYFFDLFKPVEVERVYLYIDTIAALLLGSLEVLFKYNNMEHEKLNQAKKLQDKMRKKQLGPNYKAKLPGTGELRLENG